MTKIVCIVLWAILLLTYMAVGSERQGAWPFFGNFLLFFGIFFSAGPPWKRLNSAIFGHSTSAQNDPVCSFLLGWDITMDRLLGPKMALGIFIKDT